MINIIKIREIILKYGFLLSGNPELKEMPSNKEISLYLERNRGIGFRDTLFRFLKDKHLNECLIYKKADIDRKLFSKIRRNKNYNPSRNTAISLAIALQLNCHETAELLGSAGYRLSNAEVFDEIISYFIDINNYNLGHVNNSLQFHFY